MAGAGKGRGRPIQLVSPGQDGPWRKVRNPKPPGPGPAPADELAVPWRLRPAVVPPEVVVQVVPAGVDGRFVVTPEDLARPDFGMGLVQQWARLRGTGRRRGG